MSEEVIMKFHNSRVAFLKWYVISFLLVVISVVLIFYQFSELGVYALIPTAIGIILVIVSELRRITSTFYITMEKIHPRVGLLSTTETSVSWDKVADFRVDQTVLDRMLNVGDVVVQSSGGGEAPEVLIKKAPKVKRLKELLTSLSHRVKV